MKAKCASAALRVYRFVRAAVPNGFPSEALKELDQLPTQFWRAFAARANPPQLVRNPELAKLLEGITLPRVATAASAPLFNGTIIFVQVVFDTASGTGLKISDTDILGMALYTRSATVPIQQYASQYGFCSAHVQVTFVTYHAKQIFGTVFANSDIADWAEEIINSYGFKNTCLVFPFDISDSSRPNPQLLLTTDDGYHAVTSSGTPYCVCSMKGSPVQMLDLNGYYAETLSHEIAEMIVNPGADFRNPEVCDACSETNCNNGRQVGFGRDNEYLGDATSSRFGLYYFISGIAKYGAIDPASDRNCALPPLDPVGVCVYPPPPSPGQLLSYGDAGTPGNVSDPVVVGLGGWQDFKFLFSGVNVSGENRIYAVNQNGNCYPTETLELPVMFQIPWSSASAGGRTSSFSSPV